MSQLSHTIHLELEYIRTWKQNRTYRGLAMCRPHIQWVM